MLAFALWVPSERLWDNESHNLALRQSYMLEHICWGIFGGGRIDRSPLSVSLSHTHTHTHTTVGSVRTQPLPVRIKCQKPN